MKTEEVYKEISVKIMQSYASMHDFFEKAAKDESVLESLGIDQKRIRIIGDTVTQRIKPTEVEISGKLKITTFAPDGIDVIKESLKKAQDATNGNISINYLGSGLYRLMVKAADYKEAEKLMKNATESAIGLVAKRGGTAEFNRASA